VVARQGRETVAARRGREAAALRYAWQAGSRASQLIGGCSPGRASNPATGTRRQPRAASLFRLAVKRCMWDWSRALHARAERDIQKLILFFLLLSSIHDTMERRKQKKKEEPQVLILFYIVE
jgi:hypothetical protein